MIMAIALYFTLFWGFDALRVLTSPTYGLEDVWRSQFVFGVGRMFDLGPMGLIKLAAFFGVMKLAAAAVFAVHIADRLRGMVQRQGEPGNSRSRADPGGADQHRLGGAGAVVAERRLVREQTIQLLLAGLAAALVDHRAHLYRAG